MLLQQLCWLSDVCNPTNLCSGSGASSADNYFLPLSLTRSFTGRPFVMDSISEKKSLETLLPETLYYCLKPLLKLSRERHWGLEQVFQAHSLTP